MKFPLFVLVGDRFLCEEKRKEILNTLQKEWGPDFQMSVRRAGDIPTKDLISEARTLPFLASWQALCLRDVDQCTKEDVALWREYLKSHHPKTILLFESESLERDHPLFESAAKARQVFSLEREGGRLAARLIEEKLKSADKRMTAEARKLLEERLGDSYSFLDSVLEQLIVSSGEKREIDRSAVEAFDEKLQQWEGEDLLEAMSELDFTKALTILNNLLELNFRNFPAVVGLLHWQLRRFWEAKRWQAEGLNEQEISSRLRLFSGRAAHFYKQLSSFTLREIEKILAGLFELDWQLKSGRADGRYEIEVWLSEAVGKSRPVSA